MLAKTNYSITDELLCQARNSIPDIDFKLTINMPTGNFFYDPWTIKEEYVGTVWEQLLNTLPAHIQFGEARIIALEPTKCYTCHADIDDRYHLNVEGSLSYLIDLVSQNMYPLVSDSYWYELDAGLLHSAANFGDQNRYQLVVRKLLKHSTLKNILNITIKPNIDTYNHRYMIDQYISPWLNVANKHGVMDNFKIVNEYSCNFDMNSNYLDTLENIVPKQFDIIKHGH
jgi:hypothetical protein